VKFLNFCVDNTRTTVLVQIQLVTLFQVLIVDCVVCSDVKFQEMMTSQQFKQNSISENSYCPHPLFDMEGFPDWL